MRLLRWTRGDWWRTALPWVILWLAIAAPSASAQDVDVTVDGLRAEVAELRLRIERLEAAIGALEPAPPAGAAPAAPAPALNTPPALPASEVVSFAKSPPRIDVLMQARYEHFRDPGRADGFRLRKAEIGIKGHVAPGADFSIELDPVRPEDPFRRTYLRLTPHDRLHVKLGLEKAPLGLEELTSSAVIPFVDRAEVTHRYASAEELGLHLESRWDRWLFQAAITNGNRRQPRDDNGSKAVTGRLVWGPTPWLSAGTALVRNTGPTGEARDRYNVEVKFGSHLTGVQAEGYRVNDGGIRSTAYYVAGYRAVALRRWGLTHVQPVLRYEAVHGRRQDELGLITSGVSLLFGEHRSKFQINHLWDVRFGGEGNELRAQYQIEF